MKNDFLPVPDAPQYEINSQLICRNKQTGKILTAIRTEHNYSYYSLRYPNKRGTIKRAPKTLRAQALATVKASTFAPIPSLGCRYEINSRGKVRNTRTKLIIKAKKNHSIMVRLSNGKYVNRAIKDLLWEVHGIIKKRRFRPCPCSAENSSGKFFFPHMKACACFLAKRIFCTVSLIYARLIRRENNIFGWIITYLDDNFNHNDFALQKMCKRSTKSGH